MPRNLTQVAGSFIGTMEEFHTSEKKPLVSPIIHITDRQTGKILDIIPLGDFWDDNHHKSLKDTLEFFEFRTFGDKRYSQHLEKMNRIIIPDEDGTFIEFVIFHAIKYRLQSAVVVDVYAPASYLLLKKAKVIKPQRVSEYTASQHLGFALNGTEWRPGIVESGRIRTLDIENHTNPYAYIRRIANEFELEPRFRIETDGNKVIGRYVDLLERVGDWQGREVEFGRDLLGIERKVDDSNVVTALIGLGPERDDGTRLEVFVEDEEALQRWGVPNPQTGELTHLIETYEPESTDQNMSIERLTELTRNELEKRINSVVEYTADIADLEKVPGMENKKIRFGDTIKIKDTRFNPPLYLEARVHTQDRSLSQPEKKKVTLGDYIEYTEEEVHAIWRQLQSEVRRRITAKQLYDYTYSKLIIDNKDDEVRTDVETYARTVAADAKNEAITYTNNTLEPIAVRVDNVEEDIKNHQELISKAQTDIIQAYNEIELRATKTEVDALSGRVSTVESTIQQHADMIESKIDDGQARSIFRQEASSFTFDADQINFEGHVFGEDATFTGRIEGSEIQGANILGSKFETSGTLGNITIERGRLLSKYFSEGSYLRETELVEGVLSVRDRINFEYTTVAASYISLYNEPENSILYLLNEWRNDGKPTIRSSENLRLEAGGSRYDIGSGVLILQKNGDVVTNGSTIAFEESTSLQRFEFRTSSDGAIYFGRHGGDNGWAIIGDKSRIGIYDYDYGGSFPLVVRRSPKAVEINGSFSVTGSKSAVVRTENFGRRLMYAVESPDNRFMDVIEGVFETGEYWILMNRMFAETINGYSVFPIPQGKGIAKILKKETDRFKVYVESEETVEIAFWVYGKRKGYEGIYMEEVTDFEGESHEH